MRVCWNIKQHGFFTIRQNRQSQICTDTGTSGQSGEAFDHEYDMPKDWELKEINNVMNNSISGWEKISSHRFAEYGIQRGWRRIVDKEEFHKLPEHAEIPFDKK